ncbi:hypothetical protein ACS0TY_018105 [Phlomoides rotata]
MVVVLCGSRFAAPTPFSGLVPCSLLSFRVCFLPVSVRRLCSCCCFAWCLVLILFFPLCLACFPFFLVFLSPCPLFLLFVVALLLLSCCAVSAVFVAVLFLLFVLLFGARSFLFLILPVGAFFVFFVLVGKLSRCCLAAVVASWVTPGFPGYVKNLFEDLHSKQHPGRVVVDYLNCFRGLVDNSRE